MCVCVCVRVCVWLPRCCSYFKFVVQQRLKLGGTQPLLDVSEDRHGSGDYAPSDNKF